MSTYVHRDGARQITVRDDAGRELAFTSEHYALHINTMGAGPCLTPQMAHDLADELHQWANCQQTVRARAKNAPMTPL